MENVLLIFGGESYEHDISIVTASQIFNKTRLENFNLIPLYITKNNRFFVYRNTKFCLSDFSNFSEAKSSKCFKEVVFVSGEKEKLFAKSIFGLKEFLSANIAIFACHGGDGENGNWVSYFEKQGIYSSAGSIDGLAVSMNKILFKNVMKSLKIPVVSGVVIDKNKYEQDVEKFKSKLKFLKFPIILKPCFGGSSIGLFVVKNKDEFEEKLLQAFEFDDFVLVEKFISKAREFNIAVLGDRNEYLVSEIDEPLKISEVLSFEDKYFSSSKSSGKIKTGGMSNQKRNFPANIEEELKIKIKKIAGRVFENLNLSGVVRIDFLYDELKNQLFVCEVNAIPGSLSYYFFERGKVLINDFVLKLIEISKNKLNSKSSIKQEFITKILD